MLLRWPTPLRPGDRIGVTAPSSGVTDTLRPRLDVAVQVLRDRGFEVVVGECLDGADHLSASRDERAAELTAMLADPTIRAVVPPWGGETGIDLLGALDWDHLATLDPTWVVGYSDTSTLLMALTSRLGWATVHAENLMDTPYATPPGLVPWTQALDGRAVVEQRSLGVRSRGWHDWASDPTPTERDLEPAPTWTVTRGGEDSHTPLDVTGRLIGGCLETLGHLAGTPFGDVPAFGGEQADEGLVVYLEAAQADAFSTCRSLHGLRLAGWFAHANAVLVARTAAPDSPGLTQRDAVLDALGDLDVPVVLAVECGHVPPLLTFVNGALARSVLDGDGGRLTQYLG